jgi:predicted nucleic acid-binding Zn ribbon protein
MEQVISDEERARLLVKERREKRKNTFLKWTTIFIAVSVAGVMIGKQYGLLWGAVGAIVFGGIAWFAVWTNQPFGTDHF